jgi:hypothetical protein
MRWTYSNEDFDVAQSLAHELTELDRKAGIASAPKHGYSAANWNRAHSVIRVASTYKEARALLGLPSPTNPRGSVMDTPRKWWQYRLESAGLDATREEAFQQLLTTLREWQADPADRDLAYDVLSAAQDIADLTDSTVA